MARDAVARIAKTTGRPVDQATKALTSMSPQGRFMQPDEVAHMVWSLCVHGARGVNGQALVIDGGQVLK
jgi:NAD(P)-dependent dehydrogenase (short-subunit alcohol dehydrogenase family)